MKKLLLIPLLLLSACTTVGGKTDTPQMVAGKSLLAIQQTIVATRQAIVTPCQRGTISVADCRQMDDWYNQSKPVYDAAVDAEMVSLAGVQLEGVGLPAPDYRTQLLGLETEIVALALKYGVKGGK